MRLEKEEDKRLALENELLALRRSWQKCPDHRPEIEGKAEAVRLNMSLIPTRPTLRQAHNQDPQRIADDLTLLFCWVNDQVNVTAGITEIQMESAAQLIIETYPWLRLEDVAIAMRNGITGRYTHIFNRIDPALLLSWIGQYAEELIDMRLEKAYARHANTKEDPTAERGSVKVDEAYNQFRIKYLLTKKP